MNKCEFCSNSSLSEGKTGCSYGRDCLACEDCVCPYCHQCEKDCSCAFEQDQVLDYYRCYDQHQIDYWVRKNKDKKRLDNLLKTIKLQEELIQLQKALIEVMKQKLYPDGPCEVMSVLKGRIEDLSDQIDNPYEPEPDLK